MCATHTTIEEKRKKRRERNTTSSFVFCTSHEKQKIESIKDEDLIDVPEVENWIKEHIKMG